MADTKNQDNNQDKKDAANATGELNWSGSGEKHGTKVEVTEPSKQTDMSKAVEREVPQESPKTEATDTTQTHRVSVDTTAEAAMGESSKRQAVAFIAGLIIGALLASILI